MFIIVNKDAFKCLSYKQLKSGRTIRPVRNDQLQMRKDLNLDAELIGQFGDLAKKFFTGL